MPSLNKIFMIGNVTRDPEVRYTPKVAVNRVYSAEDGEKKEETTFVDVTLWGRQAAIAGQYLRKGSPLFVEGRLQLDTWEDKQSGQKRSRLRVVAENLQLLGKREGVEAAPSAAAAPAPPRPAVFTPERSQTAPAARAAPSLEPELDVDPF
jgi:single-strand DNA-binding protein